MRCPAINLNDSVIMVKNSTFYGNGDTRSFISITGRGSQAIIDNCTFRENCYVTSNYSDGIIVNNSTHFSVIQTVNYCCHF